MEKEDAQNAGVERIMKESNNEYVADSKERKIAFQAFGWLCQLLQNQVKLRLKADP